MTKTLAFLPPHVLHTVLGVLILLVFSGADLVAAERDVETTSTLRVSVLGEAGEEILPVYVAAVSEVAPWDRPSREVVLEDGGKIEWTLEPGRYRLVAAAPGHAVEYGGELDLVAGEMQAERMRLHQLVLVEGRVEDGAGRPIAGARVRHLRRLIFDFSGRLSPRGEELLADTLETTSDEEGAFRIHLHPTLGQSLAVQAEGHALRFLPDVRLPEGVAGLQPVVLDPGSRLEVRWSGEVAASGGLDRFQLVPRTADTAGLDVPTILAVWARPLAGDSQRWTALPPGEYALWLKGPRVGAHRVVPKEVARIKLEPGGSETVTVEIPRSPTSRVETWTAAVEPSELLLPELPAPDLDSLEAVVWVGPDRRAARAKVERVSAGTLVTVENGCVRGGTVVLTTERWIAVAGPFERDGCKEPSRVLPRPRAAVAATLLPPAATEPPLGGVVEASPCAGGRVAPSSWRMTVPFRTDDRGRLELSVPAGCIGLTLRAEDLAPLAWPALELERSEIHGLGPLRLSRGAALLVRVLSSEDGRPLAGVEVAAVETADADATIQTAGRGDASKLLGGAVTTGAEGWARLYGVPAADVTILLLGPGRRFPYPGAQLELHPGEERVLDSLELPPPAALTVEVELSAELEDEEAEVDTVHLEQDGGTIGLSKKVEEGSQVRFEEVPAGSWRALGIVRLPAKARTVPAGDVAFRVAPGTDQTVVLPLSSQVYRGRVTYQGLPVEGEIVLRPIEPPNRQGFTAALDAEGRFALPLEGPGLYRGEVWEKERKIEEAVVPEIRFDDPEDEVEIRLPEGQLAGVVIDSNGTPQADARVEARSWRARGAGDDEGEATVYLRRSERTDRAGRFSFDALAPGTWSLHAEAGELESERRSVDILEDERVLDLELVVEEPGRVAGTVVDSAGRPAPGARLVMTPRPERIGELPDAVRAETGPDGAFSADSSLTGRTANVQLAAPDGTAGAVLAELGGEMWIQLPEPGGAVRISAPCPAGPGTFASSLNLVSPDGTFLSPGVVSSARVEETPTCHILWTIPRLAAGSWRVVSARTVQASHALWTGAGWGLQPLEAFESLPGQQNEVEIEGPTGRFSRAADAGRP